MGAFKDPDRRKREARRRLEGNLAFSKQRIEALPAGMRTANASDIERYLMESERFLREGHEAQYPDPPACLRLIKPYKPGKELAKPPAGSGTTT